MTNLLGPTAMETIKLILLLLLALQASLGRHFLISTHDEKIKAAGDEAGDDYYDPGFADYAKNCWSPNQDATANCDNSRKFLTSLLYNFFRANLVSFIATTTTSTVRTTTRRPTTTTTLISPCWSSHSHRNIAGCSDG